MENIKRFNSFEELNHSELNTISGGGRITGFLVAAYIDFEIGVAIGVGRAIKKAYDAI